MEITALAQFWVNRFLVEGGLAIDATVGNGHDTVFLAARVGEAGGVIGFDIQQAALEATRERLTKAGLERRVKLIRGSHTEMAAALADEGGYGEVGAIMFNLGYLPGGEKTVTTKTAETVAALKIALDLLGARGILTVVSYPGHDEGKAEAAAVSEWAKGLSGTLEVTFCRPGNRGPSAPFLIAIEKS